MQIISKQEASVPEARPYREVTRRLVRPGGDREEKRLRLNHAHGHCPHCSPVHYVDHAHCPAAHCSPVHYVDHAHCPAAHCSPVHYVDHAHCPAAHCSPVHYVDHAHCPPCSLFTCRLRRRMSPAPSQASDIWGVVSSKGRGKAAVAAAAGGSQSQQTRYYEDGGSHCCPCDILPDDDLFRIVQDDCLNGHDAG